MLTPTTAYPAALNGPLGAPPLPLSAVHAEPAVQMRTGSREPAPSGTKRSSRWPFDVGGSAGAYGTFVIVVADAAVAAMSATVAAIPAIARRTARRARCLPSVMSLLSRAGGEAHGVRY